MQSYATEETTTKRDQHSIYIFLPHVLIKQLYRITCTIYATLITIIQGPKKHYTTQMFTCFDLNLAAC